MDPILIALIVGALILVAYFIPNRRGKSSKEQPKRKTIIVKTFNDVNDQSIVMPGPERIRRIKSPFLPHGELLEYYTPGVTTLYENFLHGIKASEDGPCLGFRPTRTEPYQWISYQTVHDRAVAFGSGLIASGNPSGQKTYIGIYSMNRPEYDLASLATIAYSMVLVPLYDTLGPNAISYIVNHAGLRTIICDNGKKAATLLALSGECPTLRQIVVMNTDDITPELRSECMTRRINTFSFSEIESLGQKTTFDLRKPSPDDLFLINYTSGTTGTPKGVMLSHRNIMCQPHSFAWLNATTLAHEDLSPKTIGPFFSYLPLAHNYGQCIHANCFHFGYRIGYWSGDIKHINDDLKALKPWVMPTVPRILNKVFNTIQGNLSQKGPVANFIFKMAYNAKLKQIQQGIYRTDTIWDKLVFRKVQKEFGGQLTLMFSGAAPISEEIMMMCRIAFGCPITEGYGQTESCSGGTTTLSEDLKCGHVGRPVPFNEIKLVDVPEMGYFSENDEGEICQRGTNVMVGYFKDPEKTAETIDKDGWLHSGDIGKWLPNGTLRIIDRKKHLFKLAQGEYVAPEKIEGIYQTNPVVEQVFVDGRGLEQYTVAIVVPEPKELARIAKTLNLGGLTSEELCLNPKMTQAVLQSLQETGKKNGLTGFENSRAVHLTTEPFSTENDCMTATMKLKRPQCRSYYEKVIDGLYEGLRNGTP